MKRPFTNLSYAILAAVFLFSLVSDIRMAREGVPFGLIYLGPLFFLTLIAIYRAVLVSSVIVPEKPSTPCPRAMPPAVDADALLVLDPAPQDGSTSDAWMNTLASSIGPFRVTTPENFAKDAPGSRIIVIPSRESAAVIRDTKSAAALIALSDAGAAVIIDFPPRETAALLGVKLSDKTISARISWAYAGTVSDEQAAWLAESPVKIESNDADFIGGGFGSWLRAGAHTAVAGKATGAGGVIVTLFDFAAHSTRLRQGAVEAGLTAAFTGPAAWKLATPGLKGRTRPYADVLDNFIISLASFFAPAASWWPNPHGAPSTLIVTCTDEGVGRRMSSALDTFNKAAIVPTVFTLADRHNSAAALDGLNSAGIKPALLWNRFSAYLLGGKPLENRIGGMGAQAAKLESSSGERPAVTRSHKLRWDGVPADTLALMHENGILADSSFGPPPASCGYSFATGFPFNPVTATGIAAAVAEIPFQISDKRTAFNFNERCEVLLDVAAAHGSPLCAEFDLRRHISSAKIRTAAAELLNTAALKGLKLVSASTMLDFWRARAASSLRTSRSGDSVTITADASSDGMCLLLPASLRGTKTLSTVTIDGSPAETRSVPRGRLLPVPKGRHEIVLTYSPKAGA